MIRTAVVSSILLLPAALGAQTGGRSPVTDGSSVEQVETLEQVAGSEQKDLWDKIEAISGLASGVLVALIGFYAAEIYNRRQKQHEAHRKDRQLSLGQADTLEKFLPHLISDDPRLRESSLLIISTLLGDDLATELAAKLGGEGSAAALAQIASASPGETSSSVKRALGNVFDALEPAVIGIARRDGSLIANGFFYEGVVVTPAHVADSLPADFVLHTASGIAREGKVVYLNEPLDLAFLEAPDIGGISGVSSETITPRVGTKVVSLWYSPDKGLRGEVGKVLSLHAVGLNTQRTGIKVTKMGSPGISGAPVIDTSGRLVGVVQGAIHGDPPTTVLIPASSVTEGLSDHRAKS